MKNWIIFSMLTAFAVAFIGCSKDAANTEPIPGYGITIYDMDSCAEQVIHTSPRFGQNCETGKTFLLPQPKFDSVSTIENFFSEEIFITDSLLNAYHYVFTPDFNQNRKVAGTGNSVNSGSGLSDSDHNSGGTPAWLKKALWFLLFLVIAGLVGWFLWWLFSQRPNSSGGNRNGAGAGAGGGGNNAGSGDVYGDVYNGDVYNYTVNEAVNNQQQTPPDITSLFDKHIEVIKELQKTGGEHHFEYSDEITSIRSFARVEKADAPVAEQPKKTDEK